MSLLCGGNILKHSCTEILGAPIRDGLPRFDGKMEDGETWLVLHDSDRLSGAHAEAVPLMSSASLVRSLPPDPIVVPCTKLNGRPRSSSDFEALALPPSELVAELPTDWKVGEAVTAHGPHGPLEILPHPEEKAGNRLRYALKPSPEYEIEIPASSKPGQQLRFKTEDDEVVSVVVPSGVKPGGVVGVAPPVLIVRVPVGAGPGDYVNFRSAEHEWWRAVIPETLRFGRYFAARMPQPDLLYMHG
uniref:Uncharacterized protein n=1 Tax=Zooxanthella nutricula TaxID=1333877 RepID=A0A7S2HPX2_9DINO